MKNNLKKYYEKVDKTQIVLCDSKCFNKYFSPNDYEMRDGNVPHFFVNKNGEMKKYVESNLSHINNEKHQIVICLENLGWLSQHTLTPNLYLNWNFETFRGQPYIKAWRGNSFWDKYTHKQFDTLLKLLKYLIKKHKIKRNILLSENIYNDALKYQGIISKSNFSDIYKETNPHFIDEFRKRNEKYFKIDEVI